jgi:hypothetical protein
MGADLMDYETKAQHLDALVNSGVSRRAFAQRIMMTGAATAGLAMFADTKVWAAGAPTDADILNFALNLEYLEAEFYTVATTGRRIRDIGIDISGAGNLGATTGGAAVALDDRVKTVAAQIATDEQMHVLFLRKALGGAAIAKPAINLEALGLGFRNQTEFITLGRAFEDVGVTAYGGAAPLITDKQILGAAAQIALTEAQHAGVLRYFAFERNLNLPPLDGIDVRPQAGPGDGRVFNVTTEGLSPVRTPSQVLSIAFANTSAGVNRGGFFPEGVNGTINHT